MVKCYASLLLFFGQTENRLFFALTCYAYLWGNVTKNVITLQYYKENIIQTREEFKMCIFH